MQEARLGTVKSTDAPGLGGCFLARPGEEGTSLLPCVLSSSCAQSLPAWRFKLPTARLHVAKRKHCAFLLAEDIIAVVVALGANGEAAARGLHEGTGGGRGGC